MSRHEVTTEAGKWVFGWDQPLQTFFLQLYADNVVPDENPVIWVGATSPWLYDVDDVFHAARINGFKMPREFEVILYADKNEGR